MESILILDSIWSFLVTWLKLKLQPSTHRRSLWMSSSCSMRRGARHWKQLGPTSPVIKLFSFQVHKLKEKHLSPLWFSDYFSKKTNNKFTASWFSFPADQKRFCCAGLDPWSVSDEMFPHWPENKSKKEIVETLCGANFETKRSASIKDVLVFSVIWASRDFQ